MPRDSHDAYDVDVPSSLSSLSRGQLSRRRLLGGVLSAAAAGVIAPSRVAARGTGLDGVARSTDIRRTNTLLRLGSNENPCGLGPAAKDAFLAAAGEANRYPGRAGQVLIDALAAQHKVEPAWIYLTPGSGELLRAATMAFTSSSRSLVGGVADVRGAGPRRRRDRRAGARGAGHRRGPSRPRGHGRQGRRRRDVLPLQPEQPDRRERPGDGGRRVRRRWSRRRRPTPRILVDEAYFEYVDDPGYATAVPLAQADPRVFVTRTFSKIFGMAGLRVGYAIAHPDTIAALRKQGSSGTLSSASLAAAAAALADTAHLTAERARNTAARTFTRAKFEAAGYRVLPSSANFVMIDIKRDAGAFGALCRTASDRRRPARSRRSRPASA